MKRGSAAELRPCPRNGASRRAGAGRVRRLAFLSILRGALLLSQMCRPMKSRRAHRVLPQPAKVNLHRRELFPAFSIDRINTDGQYLGPLQQCMASIAQLPVYLESDSSIMHSLRVRGEASSDLRRSFLYPSRLTPHGFLNIGEAALSH